MTDVVQIWSYLSTEPLLWLTCTVAAYLLADTVSRKLGRHALANPVLGAVSIIALILWLGQTSYATYFEGAQFIHFLLGPATVALAVPLYANLAMIRKTAVPLLGALLAGSTAATASAVALAWSFDLPAEIVISIAPKSTTAPVAIGISEELGGFPTLTAVMVILTGIVGAMLVTPLMNALKVRDWRARGFAVGVAAHGIGTARAFQVNELAGAYAGIGMALNAVLTSLLAPLVVSIVLGGGQ